MRSHQVAVIKNGSDRGIRSSRATAEALAPDIRSSSARGTLCNESNVAATGSQCLQNRPRYETRTSPASKVEAAVSQGSRPGSL